MVSSVNVGALRFWGCSVLVGFAVSLWDYVAKSGYRIPIG